MTLEHEVRAVVAVRLAQVADRCSSSGDGAGVVRAGDKLLEVLDTLPVRAAGGGAAGDGGNGGRGTVLELFDSPPTLGDSADG